MDKFIDTQNANENEPYHNTYDDILDKVNMTAILNSKIFWRTYIVQDRQNIPRDQI